MDLYNYKSQVLKLLKRDQDAIDCYMEAIKINPRTVTSRINLSQILIHLERFDEAIPYLNDSINLDPKNARAFYYKGIIFLYKQSMQSALKCFE